MGEPVGFKGMSNTYLLFQFYCQLNTALKKSLENLKNIFKMHDPSCRAELQPLKVLFYSPHHNRGCQEEQRES
jgi:hypothetical protein